MLVCWFYTSGLLFVALFYLFIHFLSGIIAFLYQLLYACVFVGRKWIRWVVKQVSYFKLLFSMEFFVKVDKEMIESLMNGIDGMLEEFQAVSILFSMIIIVLKINSLNSPPPNKSDWLSMISMAHGVYILQQPVFSPYLVANSHLPCIFGFDVLYEGMLIYIICSISQVHRKRSYMKETKLWQQIYIELLMSFIGNNLPMLCKVVPQCLTRHLPS